MGAKDNIFLQYSNDVFIETGSYLGDGIQMAIDAGFKKIYSIELSDKYYEISTLRFSNLDYVHVIKGESQDIIGELINKIKTPITFWLDGHYSAGDTARGKFIAPLIQELNSISKHPIKNHKIIIDDLRCWNLYNPEHGFVTSDLIKIIMEINPDYILEYLDGYEPNDILAAVIK